MFFKHVKKTARVFLAYINKTQDIWAFAVYLIASFFLFIYFFRTAPPLIWDSGQYSNLSDLIVSNGLKSVLTNNFEMRTYAHPLFLALLKMIADLLKLPHPKFIYIANYVLFLLTNLIIYLRVRPISRFIANIFLVFSGFNVITLSFTNTYLTENTAIFLTAVLFYLFTAPKFNYRTALALGFTSGLFIYFRPSTLILFVFAFLFTCFKQVQLNKTWMLACFIVTAMIPISIGMINTYNNDQSVSLFTNRTNNIFHMQVHQGPVWIKYETNIDQNYVHPTMYYFHTKNNEVSRLPCAKAFDCFFTYMTKKPLQYTLSLVLHIFNMFDRVYLDTYIRDLPGRMPLLSFGNYIVLSGALLSLIFFNFSKEWRSIVFSIFILAAGLIAIYIPTVVEPRFSAPLFPFAVLLFSYQLFRILSVKNFQEKVQMITLQVLLVLFFFVISDLVALTLFNGVDRIYK